MYICIVEGAVGSCSRICVANLVGFCSIRTSATRVGHNPRPLPQSTCHSVLATTLSQAVVASCGR